MKLKPAETYDWMIGSVDAGTSYWLAFSQSTSAVGSLDSSVTVS